jgi:acetyl esterase/lipase
MSSPDTTPDYPLPPEHAVAAAAHDLPAVLQQMSSDTGYAADPPAHQ